MREKTRGALRFLVLFLFVYAVLQTLLLAADLSGLEIFLARLCADILGLPAAGNTVMSGGGLFFVDNQCTGLASGIVLASVVLALRKPDWKRKIAMIAGGALALFVLNIPRLLVVLWTAQAFGVEAARTVHVATWFLTTVFILGVWYLVTTQFGAKTRLEELL